MSTIVGEEIDVKCRLSDCCFCFSSSISTIKKDKKLSDLWRHRIPPLTNVIENPLTAVNVNVETVEEIIIDRIDDINKSTNDAHSYRYLELRNGVRIVLASNPNAVTSGAALDIRVGSFHDPVHLQGLAHLLEHVLFTGSEKFPGESYSKFLGDRGGSSNAFTTSEHTNFHFEIPSDHFQEAFTRFAAFFECPIFRQSSVQNEVEMVNSEHEKNRFDDVWRVNQVERCTADTAHAFSHFTTGSRQTLEISHSSDRNLRYELFTFWKSHYSGNLMTVALLHNASLDDLEVMAKTAFAQIRNKNIPERIWPSRPFKNSQMKTKIFIVPTKDVKHVNLTFPIEDLCAYYSASPDGFIAQLVGYKGPGGLFAYLRKQGLAHHLVSSPKVMARGCAFFMITVQLTETGERQVDDVIGLVFQYLRLLRDSIVSLRWFFEELQFLSQQQFEDKETEPVQTFVSSIAGWLHLYPPGDVLIGSYVYSDWRPDLVDRVFHFLDPNNLRVSILTKKAKYFATQVEPHYGTDYQVEKIAKDVLLSWKSAPTNPQLELPQTNELIDKNQTRTQVEPLVNGKKIGFEKQPDLFLLLNRVRMKAWFLHDSVFKVPKSFGFIKFSWAHASTSPKESALTHLLVMLIQDSLVEYSYCGQLAGLFYNLLPTKYGMELQIRGYNGKQDLFLRKLLSGIYTTSFDQTRFDQVLEVLCKSLSSWETTPLQRQVKSMVSHILSTRNHTKIQKLKAAKQITLDEISTFARSFLLENSTECFFFGSLSIERAEEMSTIVLDVRTKFLENLVDVEHAHVDKNPFLEEWFLTDPVERIVSLETALLKTQQEEASTVGLEEELNLSNLTLSQKDQSPMSANFPRKIEVIEMSNNYQRKMSIFDELSLNVDKKLEVSSRKVQNGVSAHSIKTTDESRLSDIQIETTAVEKESHNNTEQCIEEITEEIKNIDKPPDGQEFYERRLIPNHSLFIIHNEVQSASCVEFYFECISSTFAVLEFFVHLVRLKIVEYIKQIMSLGYVVTCDIRRVSDNHGMQVIVQSQYPLTVVYATVENAISSLKDFLSTMDAESFERNRASLLTNKREMLFSRMRDVANLLWIEMAESTYNFRRTEHEISQIELISLEQIVEFYVNKICVDGLDRRLLIISIGPDAILNRLDDESIRHWTSKEIEEFRDTSTKCRQKRVTVDRLNSWLQNVFDSKESEYYPPQLENVEK